MTAALAALALATVATYVIRAGSVRAFDARQLPPAASRLLRHAALGIMASLVITTLPASSAVAGVGTASAAGLAASALTARRATNMTVIMLAGVAAYSLAGALTS